MKGCLDVFIKSWIFFVSLIVFNGIIVSLMIWEPPLSSKKQIKNMTKEERLELLQYNEKFRVSSSLSVIFSLPLSVLSTYLIFRKRTKN